MPEGRVFGVLFDFELFQWTVRGGVESSRYLAKVCQKSLLARTTGGINVNVLSSMPFQVCLRTRDKSKLTTECSRYTHTWTSVLSPDTKRSTIFL